MFGGANDSRSSFLDSEAKIKIPAIPEIIHIIIQVIIYCVGLNFQIRTILVCIKEKNKTWQIHIAHSVIMSAFFGYLIPFRAITHFVPSLATYVGSWICYISAFVEYFGYHAIVIQSLLIAGVKYLFIVHTLKARSFGEKKIQRIFLKIHIIYPTILAIASIMTSAFHTRPSLKSCFGNSFQSLDSTEITIQETLLCGIGSSSENDSNYIYGAKFICATKTLLASIINCNIPEGYLYYKIFNTMKR